MKNTRKLIGIIALAAVIGFSLIACFDGGEPIPKTLGKDPDALGYSWTGSNIWFTDDFYSAVKNAGDPYNLTITHHSITWDADATGGGDGVANADVNYIQTAPKTTYNTDTYIATFAFGIRDTPHDDSTATLTKFKADLKDLPTLVDDTGLPITETFGSSDPGAKFYFINGFGEGANTISFDNAAFKLTRIDGDGTDKFNFKPGTNATEPTKNKTENAHFGFLYSNMAIKARFTFADPDLGTRKLNYDLSLTKGWNVIRYSDIYAERLANWNSTTGAGFKWDLQ